MKRAVFLVLFFLISVSLSAQPIFDLGLKAGFNNSKVTVNFDKITHESIVKAHIGAFGRIGLGRIYIQPEVYYSAKGGELLSENGILEKTTAFNYNNVDVPLLLGVKVIKGDKADLRVMAGPVFSFLTSGDIDGDTQFSSEYFENHYFGYQYGVGVDICKFFIDARMERGNDVYQHPGLDVDGNNKTFMITAGFKIF